MKMRRAALAAVAAIGAVWSGVAFAEAPGVAASGSAGATSTLPGPAAQPGTGEAPTPPLAPQVGRQGAPTGATAGDGRITEDEVRRSLEAAGYTDIDISREGDDWVARGMLNGASQRIRIDPKTGRTRP